MSLGPVERFLQKIDWEPLKLPLGFIRAVELFFGLIAYAAFHGWEFCFEYSCGAAANPPYCMSDFSFAKFPAKRCVNGSMDLPFAEVEIGSGADFYSYLLVISIFYTLGALLFYLFAWSTYVTDDRLPVLDLIVTVILAFGWLIGTISFSIAAGRVEDATDSAYVSKVLKDGYCETATDCPSHITAMNSLLSVSLIAGIGCVVLYTANVWFCFKETANFRNRNAHPIQMQQEPYTLE